MKKMTLIALFFFTSCLYAESFKIAGELQQFEKHESGLLVKNCKKKCDALKALSIKKYKPSSLITKGSTVGSLGSEACSKLLGGSSIIGVSTNGDGRDFCYFKDNSMLEIDSLSRYLKAEKTIEE